MFHKLLKIRFFNPKIQIRSSICDSGSTVGSDIRNYTKLGARASALIHPVSEFLFYGRSASAKVGCDQIFFVRLFVRPKIRLFCSLFNVRQVIGCIN